MVPFSFSSRLNRTSRGRPLLPGTHLPSKRLGVAPTHASLDELEALLSQAIKAEDYVQAAAVRDRIISHPQQTSSHAALRSKLEKALAQEDYEAAAEIRDAIAKLAPASAGTARTGDWSTWTRNLSHSSTAITQGVRVTATSGYIAEKSSPPNNRYFFVYSIQIENRSDKIVHLRNRRWDITDKTEHHAEVRGPGVIGQQPVLTPGKTFGYMSACPLKTDTGVMQGEFECMLLDDEGEWGDVLLVQIAPFLLTTRAKGPLG